MSNKKNEIDEMEEAFEIFIKLREKEINHIPNYTEIFQNRRGLLDFNGKIIECNK
jgi:hypothetical protein